MASIGRVEEASELDSLVSERIRDSLSSAGETVVEFAQRANLATAAVTDVLEGRRSWLLTELAAAASAIGVSVSDLVDTHADGALQG